MLKLVYWSVHANCLMKVLNGGDDARSTLLWNVLINGYCKVGKWGKAVELFEVMPEKYGSTWSTLINGLMKAGEIDRAMELWRSVEERDVVCWTTMINGFSQNGQHEQALSMFFEMLEEGVNRSRFCHLGGTIQCLPHTQEHSNGRICIREASFKCLCRGRQVGRCRKGEDQNEK
ncbi:putative tetratricopeptide-like helical domain superfamily [Helianthus annuus]|uniref:Putative tetratricopeptide-like helical domain-containing protein n=1 Tax=Helianthus annuus TaxID=4232 RepID=A0A251VDK3_HELAN|nr:putative tetratricopeptide-like helical domain superfamily [Helianthus annuus]KAF5817365.1 putative tetratricopeptide-like helical domain superfamily [Helianthus annuus]KAJ0776302.1 putative tetratricopeptide-like helical domain superfamily [Helianthus annuus]KAJ0776324.1 putative tetratricopeptide-like helical domain superfamily [Helianthus annuus]